MTQWDLGEVQPLSLCGGRVYGSRRPRSAPCHLLLKSLQTLPPLPQPPPLPEKMRSLWPGLWGGRGERVVFFPCCSCWRGTAESCASRAGALVPSPAPSRTGGAQGVPVRLFLGMLMVAPAERVCRACLQSSQEQVRPPDLRSVLGAAPAALTRPRLLGRRLISKGHKHRAFSHLIGFLVPFCPADLICFPWEKRLLPVKGSI